MNTSLQLTIRGIDPLTKQKLQKLAARKGTSLNSLALSTLRRAVGATSPELRTEHIRDALARHRIDDKDIANAEQVIADMDNVSKQKQERDEK